MITAELAFGKFDQKAEIVSAAALPKLMTRLQFAKHCDQREYPRQDSNL